MRPSRHHPSSLLTRPVKAQSEHSIGRKCDSRKEPEESGVVGGTPAPVLRRGVLLLSRSRFLRRVDLLLVLAAVERFTEPTDRRTQALAKLGQAAGTEEE